MSEQYNAAEREAFDLNQWWYVEIERSYSQGDTGLRGPLAVVRRLIQQHTDILEKLAAYESQPAQEERDHSNIIDQRDDYHEAADQLTAAIANFFDKDFGEHSSLNDPWQNAVDFMEAFPAPARIVMPELLAALDRVSLTDDEAKDHNFSCATYWNNAVTACKDALRNAVQQEEK